MPKIIDRDALHRHLYRKTDRLGRIKLNQTELAEEIGADYYHLSRIIKEMATAGRLKLISGTKQGRKTYVVMDPELFRKYMN